MAVFHEDPSTCDCKLWRKRKIRPKVQKKIFEEDILPGCPVRENLPPRLQHLLYPEGETNTNEINATAGTWAHERRLQYNQAEEQRKKDKRTFLYIGPNGTIISKLEFQTIHWDSAGSATRSLLTILFNNNILATHTLRHTGDDLPVPQELRGIPYLPLCSKKVDDIIYFVTKRFKCHARKVRSAIMLKCAGVAQAQQRSKLLKNNF